MGKHKSSNSRQQRSQTPDGHPPEMPSTSRRLSSSGDSTSSEGYTPERSPPPMKSPQKATRNTSSKRKHKEKSRKRSSTYEREISRQKKKLARLEEKITIVDKASRKMILNHTMGFGGVQNDQSEDSLIK
ncbi:uncharacterized protein LOC108741350 [Agrilus planipennis]|uniref:Uncharacterized protein LOC108741350 n=1 Tax=Agrilus planipennis TaxID=224129 RepID=A0A1W4X6B9_AGRPL|nr:uncharacterized protein LOC108741350 [Agrilus planipennis]